MNVVVVRETVDVGKGGTSTFITVCIFFWFNVQTMLVSLGPLSSKSQDGIEDAGDGWGGSGAEEREKKRAVTADIFAAFPLRRKHSIRLALLSLTLAVGCL